MAPATAMMRSLIAAGSAEGRLPCSSLRSCLTQGKFNHGNVRIPVWLDRYVRWLVVTPDMHRVHHSIVVGETNSNFGFNLPWWDRLLGTYRGQPSAGHDGMTIGIEEFRASRELWLDRMLLQPFR